MKQTLDQTKRIGVVADDLTSAADGASAFLARGYFPRICRRQHDGDAGPLVSVDTGSRMLDEAEAAQATAIATEALAGRDVLYKTIDSTLRGHIRAEITAAFKASGRPRLVIAPAFPAAGRTTFNGVQLLNGQPVSETAYGRDPVHPARTSHIEDLVDPNLGKVAILPLCAGDGEVGPTIAGAQVVIVDANSQAVLNRRVAAIAGHGPALWVGSPGMAEALAACVPSVPPTGIATGCEADRVLVLVGSANHVSHIQGDALGSAGASVVHTANAIDGELPIACLRAPKERVVNPSAVLAALLNEAEIALSRHRYDAVIATGGETMDALMERLSIHSFTLMREIEPGFPLGQARFADGRSILLAMKAGGFGSAMTLCNAANAILGFKRNYA